VYIHGVPGQMNQALGEHSLG